MKTKNVPVCEKCGNPILNPDGGVLLHGSITTADSEAGALLAGEPIPAKASIAVRDLWRGAYCKPCFISLLGLNVVVSQAVPLNTSVAFVVPNGAKVVDLPTGYKDGIAQTVAPGGVVVSGPALPIGNVAALPALSGRAGVGDTVRVNQNHPHYGALKSQAAKVERVREEDGVFIIRYGSGNPMLARADQVERIG